MNLLLKIGAFIAIFWAFLGCAQSHSDDTFSFDDRAYTPQYASGFVVDAESNGNTILRVTRPWQGDNPQEQNLAIFTDREAAKGYTGEHMIGYARRIVCMSTSHIAMLESLGKSEYVVGVSGKEYIMNPKIANSSDVYDVGYDSNIDFERLISLNPDVVLMYGITAENSIITAKLHELNIPYLYLGDYTEQSPLGKAEWIVAIAEIIGCRERGIALFNDVVSHYEQLRANVDTTLKPKVMFNLPYQDVWYMPADDSYMVRLIEDAGGTYIYKGKNVSSGSKGISLEEALLLVRDADIWLNVGQCNTIDEVRSGAPHFCDSEVVRRGNVYNNNRRRTAAGGSDFWESAIVHPDVVLRDLIAIMNGESDSLYYHHKLQ